MSNRSVLRAAVLALGLTSSPALADLFHYNNLLIGDRAIGLGGAFTAVADDASGVYYNPAGLAFALNNDVSGSANAFYSKETKYKDILPDLVPGEDYSEAAQGSVAPFFGGLQKLDSIAKGLVFAFAVYSTNNESTNQNDALVSTIDSSRSTVYLNFLRNVQLKSENSNISGGLGYRVANNFAIGFSANLATEYQLLQDYQYTGSVSANSSGGYGYSVQSLNSRQEIELTSLEFGFGTQYAFAEKFSVGLNLKYRTLVSQSFSLLINQTVAGNSAACTSFSDCAEEIEVVEGGTTTSLGAAAQYRRSEIESEDLFGTSQMRARFGLAYFHSTSLLLSFDVAYEGEVEKGSDELAERSSLDFSKEAVVNYHFGTEYYVAPSFPIRFGAFTNNDARPAIDKSKTGQRDQINYTGLTFFGSWAQPNSQLGLGVTYQTGSGEAQKVSNSSTIQEIESTSIVYALSAAQSF